MTQSIEESSPNLILSPPPDVSTDVYLLPCDVLACHKIIQLSNGILDNLPQSHGDLHFHHQPLISGEHAIV